MAGRTTAYSSAAINPGSEYPEELRRYENYDNMRLGTSVWRDFACKTTHSGYYGMGLTAVGPSWADHREAPTDAWRAPDPRIDLGDTLRRYSSGTPCVGDPNYDVPGCFDPDTGVGAYSTTAHASGLAGSYRLEYSGDGSSDSGTSGSQDAMRPTSYRMINESELFDLWLDAEVYYISAQKADQVLTGRDGVAAEVERVGDLARDGRGNRVEPRGLQRDPVTSSRRRRKVVTDGGRHAGSVAAGKRHGASADSAEPPDSAI